MTTLASFLDASPTATEIDQRIESLKDEIRKLRYYRNAQHSTISGLPTEIVANIFKVLVLSEGVQRHSFKGDPLNNCLLITHVCKLWRNIAVTTPQIWAVMYTHVPKELAQLYVERSGSLPLHVSGLSEYTPHNDTTVQYLLAASARIRKIEIWDCTPRLIRIFSRLEAPKLKEVSFKVENSRHPVSKVAFLPIKLGGPSLRYLSLRNTTLDLHSPALLRLRTLRLIDADPDFMASPQEMLSFLGRLKRLRYLTLAKAMAGSIENIGSTIIDMPSLLTLRLRVTEPPPLGILNHILSPSLRLLALTVDVVNNAETLLPLRATLDKMIAQIKSPHIRVHVTRSNSGFASSLSIRPYVKKDLKEVPPFKISISSHSDYSASRMLFSLLPDSIPTALSLSGVRPKIFNHEDSPTRIRQFLLSLPPSVEELYTQNCKHLVAFLSDTPALENLEDLNNPPVFSLPFLKRILLEEDKETSKAFRLSDEYTRFEEILKARKALSAEIETLTIKSSLSFFSLLDDEPLLGCVKSLNVVHYKD
ncbi:hypothetical protein ONZ45_g15872 [Pleurotus djamor]|nr:hypothetical protein ONZ45_g15872 [Pleurotus djamor]